MAEEQLHDHILRLAFLADPVRPAPLSSEDLFWKLEDPQLPLATIKECLEWLVRRGDMALDRSKYSLTPTRFFELKAQFAHVGPQGVAIWLAPIAPIRIPMPEVVTSLPEVAAAPALATPTPTPAAPQGVVVWLAPIAPIRVPMPEVTAAPVLATPAPQPAAPQGVVVWLAPIAPIRIPMPEVTAPPVLATPAPPPVAPQGVFVWLAPIAPIRIPVPQVAAVLPEVVPPLPEPVVLPLVETSSPLAEEVAPPLPEPNTQRLAEPKAAPELIPMADNPPQSLPAWQNSLLLGVMGLQALLLFALTVLVLTGDSGASTASITNLLILLALGNLSLGIVYLVTMLRKNQQRPFQPRVKS